MKNLQIIRLKELTKILGVSSTTIYRWMDSANFPKSIKLSARAVGWYEEDILEWLDYRNHNQEKKIKEELS